MNRFHTFFIIDFKVGIGIAYKNRQGGTGYVRDFSS